MLALKYTVAEVGAVRCHCFYQNTSAVRPRFSFVSHMNIDVGNKVNLGWR